MTQAIHAPRAVKARPGLYDAYLFFKGHAGYCTPPGRAACALDLARAERWAEEEGITFAWEDDPEEWQGDCERPFEVLNCTAIDEDGTGVTSLCGIGMTGECATDHAYARVVQAELAEECFRQMVALPAPSAYPAVSL